MALSKTQPQTTKEIEASNPEYLDKVGKSFGFDEDFLNYIDTLDKKDVKELLEKEKANSIEPDDDPNEVDFDLDDPSEFDDDFTQEVYNEFAGLFD